MMARAISQGILGLLCGVAVLVLAACGPGDDSAGAAENDNAGGKIKVVATTGMVGDLVRVVGPAACNCCRWSIPFESGRPPLPS